MLTARLLWLASLILVGRDAYRDRATNPAGQVGGAAKESSSATLPEPGLSETQLKETSNEEESEPASRPQMSDPDI